MYSPQSTLTTCSKVGVNRTLSVSFQTLLCSANGLPRPELPETLYRVHIHMKHRRSVHFAFKKVIFKAGYQYFKGTLSLSTIAILNQLQAKFKCDTLGESLDMLSYELLVKENDTNEKNALKLSLSSIIPFVGPTAVVFDKFFARQEATVKKLFEEAKAKAYVPANGLTEAAKKVIDDVLAETSREENVLRLKIAEKKVDLLRTASYASEEMQVLDALEFVVMSAKRKSFRHNSELASYRVCAHLFDIILSDTSLQMIDGENTSQATKVAQQDNQKACSDEGDIKNLICRKIDLIIRKSGVELSSSEWKKEHVGSVSIEQQRVKNVRTNCAMLSSMLNLPLLDDVSKVSILGMDWQGLVGCMYAINTFEDVFVVHYAGDLIIPESIGTLSCIKETLDLLYCFKHHHERLAKVIEPAVEKAKVLGQLQKLRNTPPATATAPTTATAHHKRESAPAIFFTPVTRRQKN